MEPGIDVDDQERAPAMSRSASERRRVKVRVAEPEMEQALPTPMNARLLSPAHAAVYLSLSSRWAIYRLVNSGDLPSVRLAGKLRVDRLDLDRLIDARKRSVAHERSPSCSRPARRLTPRTDLAPRARRR